MEVNAGCLSAARLCHPVFEEEASSQQVGSIQRSCNWTHSQLTVSACMPSCHKDSCSFIDAWACIETCKRWTWLSCLWITRGCQENWARARPSLWHTPCTRSSRCQQLALVPSHPTQHHFRACTCNTCNVVTPTHGYLPAACLQDAPCLFWQEQYAIANNDTWINCRPIRQCMPAKDSLQGKAAIKARLPIFGRQGKGY